ncbi:hypothetical protein [Streptomyces sp. Ncost-T10-10d]|uniref:hypothetical protein n=1 Tax=Streptomyces sp. Ncost-T10-10d TaxID=1839774 RepID=UPI00081F6F26|nr:hypothetical protein [Streptomyces sp. Ncost-T10-10d]SCF59201.1 hypothetical protein GA0115254_106124 [Streptomyces sp. Ncost-T10-10d]
MRSTHLADIAELARGDPWFQPVGIPLSYGRSGRPPAPVVVSGHSQVITARMLHHPAESESGDLGLPGTPEHPGEGTGLAAR